MCPRSPRKTAAAPIVFVTVVIGSKSNDRCCLPSVCLEKKKTEEALLE